VFAVLHYQVVMLRSFDTFVQPHHVLVTHLGKDGSFGLKEFLSFAAGTQIRFADLLVKW
jgi:hypothetical protein